MVTATHNHAGSAVTHAGDVPKDEAYAQYLVSQVVKAFGHARASLAEAELGFGRMAEWRIAHDRRVVMREGTVRTHGTFDDREARWIEGPIDLEVAVTAVRDANQNPLGIIVNFARHPAHHGGDASIDTGYPGVVAGRLGRDGWPVTLFLNGASGSVHTADAAADGGDERAEGMRPVGVGRELWAAGQPMRVLAWPPCDPPTTCQCLTSRACGGRRDGSQRGTSRRRRQSTPGA